VNLPRVMLKQIVEHTSKKKKGTGKELAFFVKEVTMERVAPLRRKIAYVATVTAVTGNPLSNAYTSGTQASSSAWAGLAADYNEWRCRAICARMLPRYKQVNNLAVAAINAVFPGAVMSGRAVAGLAPASLAIAADWDGANFHNWNTEGGIQALCTWDSNPTAKLWSLTAVSLPVINYIGVNFQGVTNATATYNGQVVCDVIVEMDCEFRGRGA